MKICILSCGRSDYTIYKPLLRFMSLKKNISLTILAFGSHPYKHYGKTIEEIYEDNFGSVIKVCHLDKNNTPHSNVISMANVIRKLARIWENNSFDYIFALGDRYEMFAAVASTVPFNLDVVHIHGGEKTLGAMDNVFRHCITSMSKLHFVSCEKYKKRVQRIIEDEFKNNVYNIGSISLENLNDINFLSYEQISNKYNIDVSIPFVLVTLHPETNNNKDNLKNASILIEALENFSFQKIITLPNNDFDGDIIRKTFEKFQEKNDNVFCFEALGSSGYFSLLKNCSFLIGNSSSSIIESASFKKRAINIGDRQKGRAQSGNIINTTFDKAKILHSINEILHLGDYSGLNIYYKKNPCKNLFSILNKKKFRFKSKITEL